MLFAPIVHARTKNNDFPSKLLVVPDNFTNEDISWARKYITQSTRYFELSGKYGRRLIFCNETVIITGISIRIKDLYLACGKPARYEIVDSNRENYAFIGLVIPKEQITEPFDVPYTVFLEQYEKVMDSLWDVPYCENGITSTISQYTFITLPKTENICESIPDITSEKTRCVLDNDYASVDSVCAGVTMLMLNKKALGFCSDIPTANTVIESDFSVVTARNAQQIIDTLEREEQKKSKNTSNGKSTKFPFGQTDENTKQKKEASSVIDNIWSETKKIWKNIPKPVKVGGFLILILAVVGGIEKD